MRTLVAAMAITLATAVSVSAFTEDGYMTAGGVGQVSCAAYQNALAEARIAGLSTSKGINMMNPFTSYAFGYYTHYNASTPGVYDLLDGVRGQTMVVNVLTIIDNWCRDYPTADFNDALFASVSKLLPTAKTSKY
jgi:hypothetical protein